MGVMPKVEKKKEGREGREKKKGMPSAGTNRLEPDPTACCMLHATVI